MSSSISYFDKFVKPLTLKESIEYKRYLILKTLFLEGQLEVPEMPKFEDVSKFDENEDDNFISVWYLNYCQQNLKRILCLRNEYFELKKKFKDIESRIENKTYIYAN